MDITYIDSRLGCTGVLLENHAIIVQGSTDIDDRALGCLKMRKSGLGKIEGAQQVNFNDSAECIVRQVVERSQKVASCTIDQVIDTSKLFNCLCHSVFNLLGFAYISSYRAVLEGEWLSYQALNKRHLNNNLQDFATCGRTHFLSCLFEFRITIIANEHQG